MKMNTLAKSLIALATVAIFNQSALAEQIPAHCYSPLPSHVTYEKPQAGEIVIEAGSQYCYSEIDADGDGYTEDYRNYYIPVYWVVGAKLSNALKMESKFEDAMLIAKGQKNLFDILSHLYAKLPQQAKYQKLADLLSTAGIVSKSYDEAATKQSLRELLIDVLLIEHARKLGKAGKERKILEVIYEPETNQSYGYDAYKRLPANILYALHKAKEFGILNSGVTITGAFEMIAKAFDDNKDYESRSNALNQAFDKVFSPDFI